MPAPLPGDGPVSGYAGGAAGDEGRADFFWQTFLEQLEAAKDPQSIPQEVWDGVRGGKSLVAKKVLGTKGDGLAVCGSSDLILAAPVMSMSSSNAVTITAVTGVTFRYTLDGSNPRYSPNVADYSSAVTLLPGMTMRAIGVKGGCVGMEASVKRDSAIDMLG